MRIQPLFTFLLFATIHTFAQHKPFYTLDKKKSRYENFLMGYADTFSINHTLFRIREDSKNEGSFWLEKYATKWMIVDNFGARNCEYRFSDFNNDGYLDLYADYRWQQQIFLFNPKQKTFIKCGYFSTDDCDSLHAVQKGSNLFYDKWDSKWDNWWSYLYVIKNYKRYNLGIIEYKYLIDFGEVGKPNLSKKYISVRKIFNDTEEKVISNIKKVDFTNFDIKKFWKQHKDAFYPNAEMSPNYELTKIYEPDGL